MRPALDIMKCQDKWHCWHPMLPTGGKEVCCWCDRKRRLVMQEDPNHEHGPFV